jgi:hypothetical protein
MLENPVVLPFLAASAAVISLGYAAYRYFSNGLPPPPGNATNGKAPDKGELAAPCVDQEQLQPDTDVPETAQPSAPTAPLESTADPTRKPSDLRPEQPPSERCPIGRSPSHAPSPQAINEQHDIGPIYSAGFLTMWVVAPCWDGAGIVLSNHKDHAGALSARQTRESFDVWEKRIKVNRYIGRFRCTGIEGDLMMVAAE